jgi:hypothetical protein
VAVNSDAIIATRSYELWYKAFLAANAMPLDTVVYGTAITGFTDVGYTSGGLSLGVDQTRNEIRMDQSFFAIRNPISEVSFTLGTELGEINAANFLFATSLGSITTVAPGAGTRGHDDWVLTDTFNDEEYTILANVKQNDNEVFRIAMWKGIATGAVDTTFEPDNPATIAVEFTAQPDTSTSPARIATIRDVLPAV